MVSGNVTRADASHYENLFSLVTRRGDGYRLWGVAGMKSNSVHNLRSFVGGRYHPHPTNSGAKHGIEIIPLCTHNLYLCANSYLFLAIILFVRSQENVLKKLAERICP